MVFNILDKYLNLIKCGKKKYELRLAYPERRKLKIGDSLVLRGESYSLNVSIIDIKYYSDFKKLYDDIDNRELGYDGVHSGSYLDMLECYSIKDTQKYGVMALKIVLND